MVTLGLDSGAFKSGLTAAEKELRASQRRIEKVGKGMVDVGKSLSLAVTLPLVAIGKASVTAAIESQDAIGQVNSALKSMGNQAGRTSEQLQALAGGLMKSSLFDDDEILRKVTANLLTFGNVSGEAFDRAQQAAVNLSARLGQDLQSSAIQVGKALNDPIKGITALQRVGVSFTETQKEQIKTLVATGQAARAQSVILGELERQFGGAAEAARKADPFAVMQQSFAEFQEKVGAQLLKAMPAITEAITSVLEAFNSLSPGMQKAVVIIGVLAAAFGPVLVVIGSIVTVAAPLIAAFGAIAGAVGGLTGIIVAATASLGGLLIALGPILVPLGLISAAVLAVYLAWKNWDKIVAIVDNLVAKIEPLIGGKLASILRAVLNPIEAVRKGFARLYDAVVGNSYVPDMVDGIAREMARLDAVMVNPAKRATEKTAAAFRKLAEDVRPILDRLFPEATAQNAFNSDFAKIEAGMAPGAQRTETLDRLQAERAANRPADESTPVAAVGGDEPIAINLDKINSGFDRLSATIGGTIPKISPLQAAFDQIGISGERLKQDLARAFTDAVLGARSFGDALRDVFNNLATKILDKAFENLLGSVLGGTIPGFATGTNYAPGGLAIVGERGPELVNLPRGSQVIPNNELQGMGGKTEIHSPTFMFPGITNPKDAREAAGQAARRYRRELNPLRVM